MDIRNEVWVITKTGELIQHPEKGLSGDLLIFFSYNEGSLYGKTGQAWAHISIIGQLGAVQAMGAVIQGGCNFPSLLREICSWQDNATEKRKELVKVGISPYADYVLGLLIKAESQINSSHFIIH